jgi:two-component system response regulator FixJ
MTVDGRRAYVIDDEDAVRRSLRLLLGSAGYAVKVFEAGDTFLQAASAGMPLGCVLLDLRMPGMDGLEVQRVMTARRLPHPVVVITAHGDVPQAVQAMKAGACDFIEKPFDGEAILRAVEAALEARLSTEAEAREAAGAAARIAALSGREAEVLRGVLAGRRNKMIAQELGISPRTVEIHRGNMMAKLGVGSLSEAVRLALAAGIKPTCGEGGRPQTT